MASQADEREGLARALRSSFLFRSLSDPMLKEIEPALSLVHLRGGETLFRRGEPGDSLYVVTHGRLRATVPGGRRDPRLLGEIGRGESVGEMAVLTGEPRSATVRATRDTELIRLGKDAFERLALHDPHLMLEVTRLIVTRYQQSMRARPTSRPTALAVVPACDGTPVAAFTDRLARAFSGVRRVLRLNPDVLAAMGAPVLDASDADVQRSALAGWLNAREHEYDVLLYEAERTHSMWTELCLRQADVALFVASGNDAPPLCSDSSPDEPRALDSRRGRNAGSETAGPHRELVLLYDRRLGPPRNMARWLERLHVEAHHNVDLDEPADFRRLARMILGEAIGLVLGGGGARGLAHIGVLKALEEAGVAIDLVGGTSMGAILGALYASGCRADELRAIAREGFVERGSLHDYTLPLVALLRGERYRRLLNDFYGDRRIEDLPLTYFCVSTNLTRSRAEVHREGPLTKWVGASMAVPGLGPPVYRGSDILVDGGVLKNLPVDVMRDHQRGPVFGCNVSPKIEMRLDQEHENAPSPWRILGTRMNPFSEGIRVPGIGSILLRTTSLPQLSRRQGKDEPADVLFEPPVGDYGLLEWNAFDELVEIGYRSALKRLEQHERNGADVAVL